MRMFMGEAYFRDREEAGARLAARLDRYRGEDALILGIPRGGVPVAAEVARRLDAELDVIVARKVGAPFSQELAIGAVTANGGQYLDDEAIRALRIPVSYLAEAIGTETAEARRREQRFRSGRPHPRMKDRIVIIVDDGLATGATMRAAVLSVRTEQPTRVVVAAPVGAPSSCAALREVADEVVCVAEPEPFYAVGLYYERFAPTRDADVQQLLLEARGRRQLARQAG